MAIYVDTQAEATAKRKEITEINVWNLRWCFSFCACWVAVLSKDSEMVFNEVIAPARLLMTLRYSPRLIVLSGVFFFAVVAVFP